MALADLQSFLQERAAAFDPTLDLTPGSPFDTQVIQPVLQRLGTDPFTVDMGVFLQDRINQEFPGLATKEGDALTDLLIKTVVVLWDPIVRENFRVKQSLSFKNPTLLTLDEADSLGANLFATRDTGSLARGVGRVYFAQPQDANITPANFVSAQGGLNFFPTEIQSISVAEMLFNVEGSLYYFDINLIAEQPGDEYNIDVDQLVTIANVGAAVQITNKLRFRSGNPAENSEQFIDRAQQDLTEHSLVTERGIIAQIGQSFSEVTRIAVTGFNDPEMLRDVITGGGLGSILAGGTHISVLPDGESHILSRRLQVDTSQDIGVDFTVLIGAIGPVSDNFTITVHSAYPSGSLPIVRDLHVRAVIAADTVDMVEQVLDYAATNKPWTLRHNELSLSNIPGGILFPDTPAGTVSVPPGTIHIGGATDIFIRGTAFDSSVLILNDIVDDEPALQGVNLQVLDTDGNCRLFDFLLGSGGNYSIGDYTYTTLQAAVGLTVQIQNVPLAGNYRILAVTQTVSGHPTVLLTPPPALVSGAYPWRLLDVLDIDLVEPKETRISGSDLNTVQGSTVVTTSSAVDFDTLGVSPGDVLRITTGLLIIGDYTVVQVLSPLFTRIQVDRDLPATATGVSYSIFRPNAAGGVQLPFIRIDTINLLDTNNQPVGSNVPYARPIDIQSNSFANAAHGIKADFNDGTLGCVSAFFSGGSFANQNGNTLHLTWDGGPSITVTFSGSTTTPASAVSQINTQVAAATSGAVTRIADVINSGRQFGLIPVGTNTTVDSGSALTVLFGATGPYTSRDIRSSTVNFSALRPALDLNFDVAQVVDGLQIGFYDQLVPDANVIVAATDFSPEIGRHIQVGARSLGSARLYFLEPTSIEFDPTAVVTLTNTDGSFVNFFPDPTLTYQRIPALPAGTKPTDGSSTSPSTFVSAGSDFISAGLLTGDLLVLDFVPIVGTPLADPIIGLEHQTLTISINGGIDKNIIFVRDSVTIPVGSVTRQGAIDQINKIVGQIICSLDGSNDLFFNPNASLIIRGTGTANSTLGLPGTDTNNSSLNRGTYLISAVVDPHTLTIDGSTPLANTEASEQFSVFRKGLQRIISTQMANQVAETGLYYFDLELLSQGTGDQYNIAASQQMTAVGYRSDGYYLTTDDANLTFSSVEKPKIHISPTILEIGTNDDPNNATALSGQNIQINYDRSVLTGSVQSFVSAETERVVNESPLARHLIPYFVRAAITYVGGSQPSVVQADLTTLITGLFPTDSFEVSDVESILSNRGATSIDNPIDLLAVIHNFDRSVTLERSQNKLNTGRLAAFIPDVITLTRSLS